MIESNEPNKIKLTSSKQIIDDNSPDHWSNRVLSWWSGFSLRTKLLAIATLVVSLLMTGNRSSDKAGADDPAWPGRDHPIVPWPGRP